MHQRTNAMRLRVAKTTDYRNSMLRVFPSLAMCRKFDAYDGELRG